jgi:hypothetical protein
MTGVSKFFVAALLLTGYTHAAAQPVAGRVKVNGMQMYYEVTGALIRDRCPGREGCP